MTKTVAQKYYLRWLCKSEGPGSRGGHVIGTSKSGKPLYAHADASSASSANFSAGDHRDAAFAHRREATRLKQQVSRAKRSGADADDVEELGEARQMHLDAAHSHASSVSR